METVGLGFYFEDLPVGRQFKTIGRTITDADITNFINATGMVESMFTDLEFLKTDSDIKGRVSPGALVYTFAEGLLVQSTMQHTGFAFLNMEKGGYQLPHIHDVGPRTLVLLLYFNLIFYNITIYKKWDFDNFKFLVRNLQ